MNATENVLMSTKTTAELNEPSNAKALIDLLSIFTKEQSQGIKDIKTELAELGIQYSVKDLRIKLESTKKTLTEACKLKEKLLQQKSDIADAQIS